MSAISLSLRQNFIWTLVGNTIYASCQWGILIVLAKLASPEKVGQFALGLAVTAPIILFTNLHLRAVQATDAQREYHFSHYLILRLINTLLALTVITAITIISDYRFETKIVILLVGLAKACEAVSDVFFGLLQQHERMDRIAISRIIKGFLSLLAMGFLVYMTDSILWGILGLAMSWLVILVSYDIRSGILILNFDCKGERKSGTDRKFGLLFKSVTDINKLVQLAWLALPLGFVAMLISLNANIPRYLIEHNLGERDLGIFASLAYFMVAGGTVVNALGQSASPRLAKYYSKANGRAFRNLLLKLLGVSVILGVAGILMVPIVGNELLTLIYRPEYAEYLDVFFVIMIVAGLSYIAAFLGYGMTAARYFKVQIPIFLLVVLVNLLSCYWLIPSKGLIGAPDAILISIMVQIVISVAIIRHAYGKIGK